MRTRALIALVGLVGLGAFLAAGPAARSTATAAPGLYVFDLKNGRLKRLLATKQDHERFDVAWSPDGRWIASTDTDDFLVDVVSVSGGAVPDVESVA